MITRDNGFPDPKPTLSSVKQKKTKREQIVLRLLFLEMQPTLGYCVQVFARHTNGQCGKFHVTRRTITRRIWARAQEIFQNPDIRQQFCASPRKRRSVDNSRNGANHDEICEAVVTHHTTPFLRERPSGSLLMLLECQNHALELFAMMGGA